MQTKIAMVTIEALEEAKISGVIGSWIIVDMMTEADLAMAAEALIIMTSVK